MTDWKYKCAYKIYDVLLLHLLHNFISDKNILLILHKKERAFETADIIIITQFKLQVSL